MAKAAAPSLPSIVYAEASVRSVGGVSLFETTELVTSETVESFFSEPQLLNSAVRGLRDHGFEVLDVGATTISIAGAPKIYQDVFRTRIIAEEREAIKEFGQVTTATFLESPDTEIPGLIDPGRSPLAEVLEGVSLNEPAYPFANAFPPPVDYWHLDVPADVSLGMNADRAHRAGITGRCVNVVMVDTGWYRHPFFVQRGYRATPVVLGPGATDPERDEHGHGTGESANLFAVAPDVDFTMVKWNFVNAVAGFKTAVALKPDIISCSWGYSRKKPPLSAADQALAAAVADAVRRGIIVVFAAGNCHWGFPAQHPDVISAGGVYMHADGSLEATPYASGFASNIYKGRDVPDVCGLVGLPPKAIYIMLPVQPKGIIDSRPWNHPSGGGIQGGNHPKGDETTPDDGWAAFSGTSAAAPQVAGVCALILQACRPCGRLRPHQVRTILKRTARDVTAGKSCQGNSATRGPDLATGHGLTDAFRATMLAWFRCKLRPPLPVRRRALRLVATLPPALALEEESEEGSEEEGRFLEDIDRELKA